MSKRVIINVISRFSGTFMCLGLFVLIGLGFLNNQLSFDIPASSKVRDAAGFTEPFEEAEKLDLRSAVKEVASTYVSAVPVASYYAPYAYSGGSSSSYGGFHISNPTPVGDPSVDAGYGVMRYNGTFLYGHSSLAFSPLKSLYVGSTFTVTMDGETATYVVRRREVFDKSTLDGSSSLRWSIYRANFRGSKYSLSLMTCGNGSNDDSNYRLVLFADRV